MTGDDAGGVFDDMWSAFEDAGMFLSATVWPVVDEAITFTVDFRRDAEMVLDGAMQTVSYQITYLSSSAPTLKKDSQLSIGGVVYALVRKPKPDSSGTHSIVDLRIV
jgi:hypothetical protein